MNEGVIFGIGGMIFVLVIIVPLTVVLVWQGFKTWQMRTMSRVEIARDEAYRKLAEEAISVQQKMAGDLSDLRIRVTSIEKMLREVD
ncbi:hypothetical protein [Desulforamulus ruminis]|uniref:Uncharacterized protein n=1 Tax=Desulforamulus ruminis (strain ATCC 23193 / DSM 2154 / NCIMB 8452 / DL) TaxID=696281 RepID=F6DQ67_DESRL|nr:hypothetical protein [Desulforamulus ruminis]AEG59645.1 hypothetical protein Desru_1372 [Desulforamulus ruminis DSM 2154]